MAIFYEHIKGCGPDNKYTSWIKWSNGSTTPTDCSYTYLPTIKVGEKSFGTIITSDAIGQTIKNDIVFGGNIKWEYDQGSNCSIKTGSNGDFTITGANDITFNATEYVKFITGFFETDVIKATTSIETKLGTITKIQADTIEATGKCQANYFNATSDARAKSNIKPAQFSALDVIKQLPIYTFNYLNDPKLSVGLIAQEAAEHDLDGFNMVDNLDAAGEFGDFMQMKESKLVYVLWKAVQELTDEVELLKAQLNNIK